MLRAYATRILSLIVIILLCVLFCAFPSFSEDADKQKQDELKINTNVFNEDISNNEALKGKVIVKVVDILGSGVENVNVILNEKETYTTNSSGYVNLNNISVGQKFSLVWYRDGYLFDPKFYEGVLSSDSQPLEIEVTIYADNAYVNCKEIKIDLSKLKKSFSLIYKVGSASRDIDIENTNKKFLTISKYLKKIPQTAMICEDNSKYNSISYERSKSKIKESLKILYKESIIRNKSYAKNIGKKQVWLKKQIAKLKMYRNIINTKVNTIPEKIYYLKS